MRRKRGCLGVSSRLQYQARVWAGRASSSLADSLLLVSLGFRGGRKW